jgi:AcrR family transcriptional regulator
VDRQEEADRCGSGSIDLPRAPANDLAMPAVTKPVPARPRRRAKTNTRGRQAREAILDVAERHFGTYGYKGASIAAIAEEVGLSDPGLLHHFRSKAGLLEELLKERFSVDEVKLHEGENIDISRLFSVLLDIVRENVGRPSGVKLLLVLFAESLTANHPAYAYFNHRYNHVRQILTRHILSAQVAGQVRADISPEALAVMLIAVLDGIQLQWLQNDQIDMPDVFAAFSKLIQPALGPKGRGNLGGTPTKTDLPS